MSDNSEKRVYLHDHETKGISGILDKYSDRGFEGYKPPWMVKLDIGGQSNFKKKLNEKMDAVLNAYKLVESNHVDGEVTPFFVEHFDEKDPITFSASAGPKSGDIYFELVLDETGECIGNMHLKLDQNLKLTDRYSNRKYQKGGNSIGSILLLSSNVFANQVASDRGESLDYDAVSSKIDIMVWLYNNGFEPTTVEDLSILEKIFAGDDEFFLGEEYVVYSKKTKAPVDINFKKKIESASEKNDEKIVNAVSSTRERILK
ncbi:MAG: hypothetical protein WC806_00625 [Candidatus Gracilibacteria bacterium]|jgi:hypothetical protein